MSRRKIETTQTLPFYMAFLLTEVTGEKLC